MNGNPEVLPFEREQRLRDLVQVRVSLQEAVSALAGFSPFDGEEVLDLTRADARLVLNRYLDGSLSADDLHEWADAIEVREDLGREEGCEEVLGTLLYQLANPVLEGEITPERVRAWLSSVA
ncbi:hypothetical protein [Amycolatopsis jejuensis]|uniref:hypothetical protein n=1 Tax=Amycolatopsis jejuensis TaxID=330084 RepID=UPI0005247ADC|nr:hypothetical protein [Amycolatopsis jejuensis]